MQITVTASGISLDGPLVAGEVVAVTVSGLSLAAEDKPTLALLARFPDALLASVELAEDAQTPGTWTGELDTATKQTALFFATARADERRDAALELVSGRVSLARLTVPMANSALCPKPDGSPFASPVYVPVPGPPGTGGDPYEQNPEMDGAASPGTSDEYARGDHRHPTDTTRQAVIEDLAAIRTGAAAGATAVQPSALAAYRTATEQNAIDGAQDAAISAKYTKPATGIPASDLASAVQTALTNSRTPTAHASTHAANGADPITPSSIGAVSSDEFAHVEQVVSQLPSPSEILSLDAYNNVRKNGTELNAPPSIYGRSLALQEGIAPAFSSSSTYAVGDYCTHEGLLYKCTTAVTTAGAWDSSDWTAVAVTGEMGQSTPLPFDAEVEYVTVPAGAYILPEAQTISPQINLSAQIRLQSAPSSSAMFFIGNWSGSAAGSTQIKFNSASNCTVMNGGSSEKTLSNAAVVGQFGTVSIQGPAIAVGTATNSADPNTSTLHAALDLGIGACVLATGGVGDSTITGVATDIASFTFRSGGAITRCLVPVRVGTTGYLYDKVSGRLFGSATSTALVPGPDKATPTITTPGRIVELTPALRYSFAAPTHSVSGTSATVACEDRAINDFTVATGITSLTITPPAAVTGRARDFFCRVTLTDSSLPTVTLSGGTIDIGASEIAGMTQGVNLLMFTEIASGHWLASRRSAS
jgi:hypothetical protein